MVPTRRPFLHPHTHRIVFHDLKRWVLRLFMSLEARSFKLHVFSSWSQTQALTYRSMKNTGNTSGSLTMHLSSMFHKKNIFFIKGCAENENVFLIIKCLSPICRDLCSIIYRSGARIVHAWRDTRQTGTSTRPWPSTPPMMKSTDSFEYTVFCFRGWQWQGRSFLSFDCDPSFESLSFSFSSSISLENVSTEAIWQVHTDS